MKRILIYLALFVFTTTVFGQNTTKRLAHFNLDKKIALQGYDPVAYFKQKKAVKGKKEMSFTYEGIVYYFSSNANLDSFTKMPAAFEPQYGGWCAYAMGSTGEKVEIDPETFKIIDGKLYLFYNAYFNNTLKSWNKNEATFKKNADTNWIKTLK
jgi:YHS domain-containing protein